MSQIEHPPATACDARTERRSLPAENRDSCVLARITDSTYLRLARCSYPLTRQYLYGLYSDHIRDGALSLAQYYAGMRCLFGEPGSLYDDWKGSFSFAFEVTVFRKALAHAYLLNIEHFRGSIEFRFRRLLARPGRAVRLDFDREPLRKEFSQEDMTHVESYVYGYVQGYLEATSQLALQNVPDFVLLSESNNIISGYIDGEFFESRPERIRTFNAEKKRVHDLIRFPVARWPDDDLERAPLTIELEPATRRPRLAH